MDDNWGATILANLHMYPYVNETSVFFFCAILEVSLWMLNFIGRGPQEERKQNPYVPGDFNVPSGKPTLCGGKSPESSSSVNQRTKWASFIHFARR